MSLKWRLINAVANAAVLSGGFLFGWYVLLPLLYEAGIFPSILIIN